MYITRQLVSTVVKLQDTSGIINLSVHIQVKQLSLSKAEKRDKHSRLAFILFMRPKIHSSNECRQENLANNVQTTLSAIQLLQY